MQTTANAELRLIGEIAMWFGNIELYLELGIWQLVAGKNEEQRRLMEAVTTEMSFDRKVHAFVSVFKLRFPTEAEDSDLDEIAKELFSAQEERNAILHSAWSYSAEAGALTRMKGSAKAKRGLHRGFHVMSEERLGEVRDRIVHAGQRFARFSMERVQKRIPA